MRRFHLLTPASAVSRLAGAYRLPAALGLGGSDETVNMITSSARYVTPQVSCQVGVLCPVSRSTTLEIRVPINKGLTAVGSSIWPSFPLFHPSQLFLYAADICIMARGIPLAVLALLLMTGVLGSRDRFVMFSAAYYGPFEGGILGCELASCRHGSPRPAPPTFIASGPNPSISRALRVFSPRICLLSVTSALQILPSTFGMPHAQRIREPCHPYARHPLSSLLVPSCAAPLGTS